VGIGETNKTEPLLNRREREHDIKTRILVTRLGKVSKKPDYCADGVRRKGGVNLIWAFMRNCGNQFLDDKGEIQVTKFTRVRVPMHETGAEWLVVVMKWQ